MGKFDNIRNFLYYVLIVGLVPLALIASSRTLPSQFQYLPIYAYIVVLAFWDSYDIITPTGEGVLPATPSSLIFGVVLLLTYRLTMYFELLMESRSIFFVGGVAFVLSIVIAVMLYILSIFVAGTIVGLDTMERAERERDIEQTNDPYGDPHAQDILNEDK